MRAEGAREKVVGRRGLGAERGLRSEHHRAASAATERRFRCGQKVRERKWWAVEDLNL